MNTYSLCFLSVALWGFFLLRDAEVFGYEELIEGLVLPDPDDRHVVKQHLILTIFSIGFYSLMFIRTAC